MEKGRKLRTVKYCLNLYAWLVRFTFSKIKLITMKYWFSLNFLLCLSPKKHQLLIFLLFIWDLISCLVSLFKFHPVLLFKMVFLLTIEREFLWCSFCVLLCFKLVFCSYIVKFLSQRWYILHFSLPDGYGINMCDLKFRELAVFSFKAQFFANFWYHLCKWQYHVKKVAM